MPTSHAIAYRRRAAEMREAARLATNVSIRDIAEAAAKAYTDVAARLEREFANRDLG